MWSGFQLPLRSAPEIGSLGGGIRGYYRHFSVLISITGCHCCHSGLRFLDLFGLLFVDHRVGLHGVPHYPREIIHGRRRGRFGQLCVVNHFL
jgi:hypothetical protein